ncbi:Uncharacterised protein [Mycobacteroides abscessus subsp. massiliense]|nr:Uncharacterised protein [Mycobacteroides abscessus subsp. massiliense]
MAGALGAIHHGRNGADTTACRHRLRVLAGAQRGTIRCQSRSLSGLADPAECDERHQRRAARNQRRRLHHRPGGHAHPGRAGRQPHDPRCAAGHQLLWYQHHSHRAERGRLHPDVDSGRHHHGRVSRCFECGPGGHNTYAAIADDHGTRRRNVPHGCRYVGHGRPGAGRRIRYGAKRQRELLRQAHAADPGILQRPTGHPAEDLAGLHA